MNKGKTKIGRFHKTLYREQSTKIEKKKYWSSENIKVSIEQDHSASARRAIQAARGFNAALVLSVTTCHTLEFEAEHKFKWTSRTTMNLNPTEENISTFKEVTPREVILSNVTN